MWFNGLGFKVQGLGLEFRVSSRGLRVVSLRVLVWGSERIVNVQGLGVKV